jgi:hypothetical protein
VKYVVTVFVVKIMAVNVAVIPYVKLAMYVVGAFVTRIMACYAVEVSYVMKVKGCAVIVYVH